MQAIHNKREDMTMSKKHSTSEPAPAQANTKGCGCAGHRKYVQGEKSADAHKELVHNNQVRGEHPIDRSDCCCGDKTAS